MCLDLVLVFPPHWGFGFPHLSLPTLAASTRKAGFQVAVRDLNVEQLATLLSPPHFLRCIERINNRLGSLSPAKDARRIAAHEECLEIAGALAGHIEPARRSFNASAEPALFNYAGNIIDNALRVISVAYETAWLSKQDYTIGGRHAVDLDCAFQEAQRADANPYYELLDRSVVETLLDRDPRVVGLSISSSTQLVPALTLAHRLRQAAPSVRIVAGGALTTHFLDVLPRAPDLFDWFDYIVIGEGEITLNHLLASLSAGRDPGNFPGLYHRNSPANVGSGPAAPIAHLPTPDFSDLDFSRYLATNRILPLLASRGCPWSRCTFCALNISYQSGYRERPVAAVVDDMAALVESTGARHFSFNDETISPERTEAIACGLEQRGLVVSWDMLARVDDGFTEERLATARRNGLTFIKWGVESGSQRELKRMGKGISVHTARRVLRRTAAADIWNHVFVLLGFPGQTRADFELTRDFLLEEQSSIDSASVAPFSCDKGSPVFHSPDGFGLAISHLSKRYIGPEHDYEITAGASRREMARWIGELDVTLSHKSHLGVLHRRGLTNSVLFLLVDAVGRAGARQRVLDQADSVRRVLSLSSAEVLSLTADFEPVEVLPLRNRTAEPASSPGALAFFSSTGELMAMSSTGFEVFDVLRAGGTVAEAVMKIAVARAAPRERVAADCIDFTRILLLRGVARRREAES